MTGAPRQNASARQPEAVPGRVALLSAARRFYAKQSFDPGVCGLFLNPFYFARQGLYRHIAALAREVLGGDARSLPAPRAEAQLAASGRGDPWLDASEVMTLSFVESRILSVRLAGEFERRTGASPEQREQVAEAIRLELFAAMERVHATGGRRSSGWIYEEWPAIARGTVERCTGSVPQDLLQRLALLLPSLLSR